MDSIQRLCSSAGAFFSGHGVAEASARERDPESCFRNRGMLFHSSPTKRTPLTCIRLFQISQFCIVKTGLIHLAFLRILQASPEPFLYKDETLEQISFHTMALIQGQRGSEWKDGGDLRWMEEDVERRGRKLTFWYREWLRALLNAGANR
jgi:hypothetical protein